MTKGSASSRRGSLFLRFFALPFLGVGLFMGWLMLSTVWDWAVMQSWQEVPVQIVHLEMARGQRSDATTWEVKARYRYEWRGRLYSGDRVAINSGSDNIGQYWPELHAHLSPYLNGDYYPGYLDPDDPERSVLVRDLRWGRLGFYLIFVLTFGGAGLGMLWFARFQGAKTREQEQLQQLYPAEPWKQREDWAANQIRPSSGPILVISMIFAFFWNLVSAPAWFFVPELLAKRDLKGLLVAIFPLVGVGLAVWAARSWVRWRRFGKARLQLKTLPAKIGGFLQGEIDTHTMLLPPEGFTAILNCIRRRTSGSGKNRSTHETILAQEESPIPLQLLRRGVNGTIIPLHIPVPRGGSPWDDTNPSDQTLWRLEVRAEVPGVDYLVHFEIPVFSYAPAQSHQDPPFPREESDLQSFASKEKIRISSEPGGELRIVAPMARRLGAALGLTAFTAIWSGFLWFMLAQKAPLIFSLLFGFFELILIVATLDLWFTRTVITVDTHGLRRRSGLFGIGRTKTWTRDNIKSFHVERGMQAGNKLYQTIKLHTAQGSKKSLLRRISSRRHAEQLIARLRAHLQT
ncbi:MAG: hypothetical protein C0624_12860 [Desulfuromonas sp.]|nr:MAG: hypothetical protein C0624_12860 [Desulfuromonas sp.]